MRAVLEMRSVTSADAGPYTCRASNPHGDHSQVFDVAIIGEVPKNREVVSSYIIKILIFFSFSQREKLALVLFE